MFERMWRDNYLAYSTALGDVLLERKFNYLLYGKPYIACADSWHTDDPDKMLPRQTSERNCASESVTSDFNSAMADRHATLPSSLSFFL